MRGTRRGRRETTGDIERERAVRDPRAGGGCVTPPGATGATEPDPHQFWHSRRRLRAVRAIPGTCGLPSADAMSNGLMPERPSMNHCNLGRASGQLRTRETSPAVDHDRGRPGRKADTLEDNWRVSPKANHACVDACETCGCGGRMWPGQAATVLSGAATPRVGKGIHWKGQGAKGEGCHSGILPDISLWYIILKTTPKSPQVTVF